MGRAWEGERQRGWVGEYEGWAGAPSDEAVGSGEQICSPADLELHAQNRKICKEVAVTAPQPSHRRKRGLSL